jgi:hypothetical protein
VGGLHPGDIAQRRCETLRGAERHDQKLAQRRKEPALLVRPYKPGLADAPRYDETSSLGSLNFPVPTRPAHRADATAP